MRRLIKVVSCAFLCVVVSSGAASAAAAEAKYPTKPIRMVLPFAPGGSSVNIVGRMVAEVLTKELGAPIVIDNRAGAAGNIGAEHVAKANSDGYTLLFSTASLVTNSALYKNPGLDPIRDFAPVTMVYTTPTLYIISTTLPVTTVRELADYAKKHPGKLTFGSSGIGGQTHLAAQLFFDVLDIQAVHVPYKGTSQAMPDLISGRIQFFAAAPAAALPYIKDKRIKALAIASKKRLPSMPDVPSTHEVVKPDFEVGFWSGLWAPAGTPVPVITRLYSTLHAYFLSPDGQAKLEAQGAIPVVSRPEEFAAFLKADLARWSEVIRKSGIKPE